MSTGIELPESHHLHEDHPLILPVSLAISIMAVLVAGASLLGHRAHTEGLRLETQAASRWTQYRSEEHTSELQSRGHLVCRLLLEKKKIETRDATTTHAQCERRPPCIATTG